jgi:hypothetical protein
MTDWMLTTDEIIRLIEQLEELDPQPSLSKWIAKAQARKLLEYIRTKCIRDWYKLYGEEIYEEIIKMESELEASQ